MAWFVYILLCDQKTFYVGLTDNIERRLKQHRNKESFFTKKFSEIELVYNERYSARNMAENRESQLKKWSVAKKKALIGGRLELWMIKYRPVCLFPADQGNIKRDPKADF